MPLQAQRVQIPGNVAGSGTRIEVVLDDGSTILLPTIASSYVAEGLTVASATPIKLTVTDDSAPPGAATLTGVAGKVAIAAGASSVVITRAGVATTTKCFVQKLSLDATLTDFKAVCTANTITITGNANATADCYFDFIIFQAA